MTAGSSFRLFDAFAHRYDLHTPAHHYGRDHAFVLDALRGAGTGARLLDVGCGTGVFVEKALTAGFEAVGIDSAPGMVEQAASRLGPARVRLAGMESVTDEAAFDAVCALSWVINYAADEAAALDILGRLFRALVPGGRLLLQTAHAPNMDGRVFEDRESSPDGRADDVVFLFQFQPQGADRALARYVYAGKSLGELLWEEHPLAVANAEHLSDLARRVGFTDVRIFGSWARDPLGDSISPWIQADRGAV